MASNFRPHLWLIALFLLSLPIKLIAAHNMGWDIDVVVVIARGMAWLNGGDFPAYGTLSSVAAYNMPFLVWMHLPAMLFTHDARLVMLITLLIWNATGTVYVYRTGAALFSPRAGLMAAALFTFSETGISSAYTAWAQVTLPTFYGMVFFHLWQAHQTRKGRHLVLSIVLATCAFTTHFSAVMLFPAMAVFLLLTRTRPSIRAVFAGSLISLVLLLPYLAFEAPREFSDIKAFLSRSVTISPDIMAQYESIKPGGAQPVTPSDTQPEPDFAPASLPPIEPPSRLERAVNFALSLPGQFLDALALFAMNNFSAQAVFAPVNTLVLLVFFAGSGLAVRDVVVARAQHDSADFQSANRFLVLLVFVLVFCSGLIFTRASPSSQMTYYTGITGLQWVLVAYPLERLWQRGGFFRWISVLLVAVFIAGNAAERISRVTRHDDSAYSRFNVALYRHIEAATDYIASDWNRADPVTVSYDVLPEMDNLWWVLPWHTVDALYRMGTPFDVLLALNHRVENRNQSAEGLAEDADYIVVYTPGLARYDLSDYEQAQFGAIIVLKPKEKT